jgi:hypothetical protein
MQLLVFVISNTQIKAAACASKDRNWKLELAGKAKL